MSRHAWWVPWVVYAGVLGFLALDQLATGLAVDGYDWQVDYVSSLAARGSTVWPVGAAAMLSLGLAHLAAGRLLRDRWRAGFAAGTLSTAGLFLTLASTVRVGCPQGEAGCGIAYDLLDDRISALHGGFAGIYLVLMLVAMVAAGFASYKKTGRARLVLLASIPIAGLAWYALGRFGAGPDFGLWERIWLTVNGAWLVLVSALAPAEEPATSPQR